MAMSRMVCGVLLVLCSTICAVPGDGRLVMNCALNKLPSRRKLQQEDSSLVAIVEVLRELKRAITSDPSGVLDSWDVDNSTSSALDPCRDKWSGLTCDEQGVDLLAINLSGKQLRGTITPSLSLLSLRSLTSLDLSQNNLTLSSDVSNLSSLIPPSLTLLNLSYTNAIITADSPQHQLSTILMINVSSAQSLEHLWLDGMQLSGSLPQQMGRTFPSLQTLSLSHNSLTGQLPAAAQQLLSFHSLQHLDLSHNNLSGTLDSWCGIGSNLSATLTYLDVSYNTLQGVIPPTLANCSALQHLDLSYNGLRGSIPAALPLSCRNLTFFSVIYAMTLSGSLPSEFGLLSRLESLLLEGNNFSGSPLPILLNCSALRTIHFYGNVFEGRIPSEFGSRLPNLSDLVLGNNSFSGPLPPSLANCSFTNLMLGFNKFSGSILGEMLGKWTQLRRQIDLQSNSFTGSIPPQIGNLTNLAILILNNNFFSGSFPQEMGLLSSLEGATFQHNSFSGNFPGQIFNCTGLMHLLIYDNNLQGPLPSSIGMATKLSYLEARNNLLSGSLPDALSNCTQLQNFSLGYNHFTGSIPGYLASVPNILFFFDLSHNNFSGVVPTGFGHMKQMQTLDLSHNKLSGQIPGDLSQGAGLLSLNLAANELEGAIPASFGDSSLFTLALLNLSYNSLSGNIPSGIGEMPLLQELDLSNNELEGSIPATFSRAPSLVFLNLSYNNLEGQVPALFANATSASFLGNPQLCGKILNRSCATAGSHRSRLAGRKGAIIGSSIGAAVAVLMICLLVMVAHKWKRRAQSDQRVLIPDLPTSPTSKLMKLHLHQIIEATDNFSMRNLIGTGASGSVYKGVMPDGKVLAFKKFTMESSSLHAFFRELQTTRQAKHRNLIKIFGYWSNHMDDNILILEFMPNGSLEEHLHNSTNHLRSCKLTWEERWHIAIAVAEGLVYLHEDCPNSPIIHCDIKPSNILFDSEMQACISDFGLAKIVLDMVTSTQNLHGTLGYMAPECASFGHISPKCDVYSYGIIMLELMSGIRPTDSVFLQDGMTLIDWAKRKVMDGSIQEILDETMASMYDKGLHNVHLDLLIELSLECTRENSRDRPTMNQVLARLCNIAKIGNLSK
ncbi:hypothetical protein GOP47_0015688 [Adiantum capillus-veneris]|uniref:non-specific serine/threonine protein kinase n=1 Tax=Adiantum capillus-veneris TaxID=13818 RepID=A0A9D4UKX7_ADICA|nr:hypothetical protein GOP47_0015688 [Adiantum capillus-veneris]